MVVTSIHAYTRKVRTLKFTLPLLGTVVVAAMVIYAALNDTRQNFTLQFSSVGQNDAGQTTMSKPHLQGVDANGQPYNIQAEEGVQTARDRLLLKGINGDITLKDGRWLNLQAKAGKADMAQKTLGLDGGVHVYSDIAYEFHTDAATIRMETATVESELPVYGQGPFGTLKADRFTMNWHSKQAVFTGNVHVVLFR
ncbi:MAG: LPS export ABC transporter periplasmic protein LptC [Alphaproteobacteria bacterium]|nr:LPS export ABC transporter periplasmic protein LptC [Alphaproteobacteria bacterium]